MCFLQFPSAKKLTITTISYHVLHALFHQFRLLPYRHSSIINIKNTRTFYFVIDFLFLWRFSCPVHRITEKHSFWSQILLPFLYGKKRKKKKRIFGRYFCLVFRIKRKKDKKGANIFCPNSYRAAVWSDAIVSIHANEAQREALSYAPHRQDKKVPNTSKQLFKKTAQGSTEATLPYVKSQKRKKKTKKQQHPQKPC